MITEISKFEKESILIVDDTLENLQILTSMLRDQGYEVRPVLNGRAAIKAAQNNPPDLIMLDINLPEINGFEVCKILKSDKLLKEIPIIFLSGRTNIEDKINAFLLGGIDYITKPFQFEEIKCRLETHLKLSKLMNNLEKIVDMQMKEISSSQMTTIIALAKLAQSRDDNTGTHLFRVQNYCKVLAVEMSANLKYKSDITKEYIDCLYNSSTLHDIGKVAIPDIILLKPGNLTADEFEIIKTHTTIGAETLETILQIYPKNSFIRMGKEIALSHHEKWDGCGYPEGLKGKKIPLSAQIMAVADVYDALRSPRIYKSSFNHEKAIKIITQGGGITKPEHFNPHVLKAFKEVSLQFNDIYNSY